jgi:hypothetical protein
MSNASKRGRLPAYHRSSHGMAEWMEAPTMNPKRSILRQFPLGQIVITANARDTLPADDVLQALARHAACDWGDVDEEDRQENELSLLEGFRLFSVYHSSETPPKKFWIITEGDRSATTVLLPEDY